MSYQVHITSTAEHDIMRAADYIEFTLKNPDVADNLLDAATERIDSLAGPATEVSSGRRSNTGKLGHSFCEN